MQDPTTAEDAELLADRGAPADTFAEFYRRHAGPLLAWCAQRDLSAADAADVTAETFVAALYRRHQFDRTRSESGSAGAWLQQIAFNVVSRRQRTSARERAAYLRWCENKTPLTERDTAEYAALREQARETLEWVTGLVPAQQHALVGRALHGKPYAQLAAESGVSEVTVRRRVSRAIASLRRRRTSGGGA